MTDSEKIEKPPFNVGDLVMLRNKDLKLQMFKKHKPNDLGIVIGISKSKERRWSYIKGGYDDSDKWNVIVMWQQYSGYNYHNLPSDTTKIWHTRLKKVA
jgi:hypothetical protein